MWDSVHVAHFSEVGVFEHERMGGFCHQEKQLSPKVSQVQFVFQINLILFLFYFYLGVMTCSRLNRISKKLRHQSPDQCPCLQCF